MTSTPAAPTTPSRLRWLLRPLAFSAGFAAVMGVLYAIGSEPYETAQLREDRAELARMATGRAVVFGSSHGKSIEPEQAGLDGVNFSHGGQDVFEMVYMARAVKRAAPKLDTVIFTLSYFTFALDNAAYLKKGTQTRIGRRMVMYSAFPSYEFVSGDGASYVKGMLSPVITRDHWKRVLWQIEEEASEDDEGDDEGPTPKEQARANDRDAKVASEKALASHARSRCAQYAGIMRNMASNHENLHDDAFEALRDVSHELEQAGVRVVLVTPPYYETYNACFDAKRQALTRRLGRRVASEVGAEYIDAGKEPEFAATREYFRNSDHLNRDGKAAFSRWLAQKLTSHEFGG